MHSSHLLFVQSAHRGRVSIPKVRCPNDIVRASRAEGCEKTAFVEFGKVMKSIEAISGTQRDHEPACSGGSLIKAATRFMEDLQSQNRARMGTMKPGGRQCELADPFYDSDLRRFTTAVTEARAWKALVGMVGDKGEVPLFVAWAKARINLLDPAITRDPFLPAISHDLMETAMGATDRLPSGGKLKGN